MNKVAIIIPCYNQGQYIEEAIESAISQTFKDIEIICINDGSTDNTSEIVKRLVNKYKNIQFIDEKENKGVVYSRNLAIESTTAKYILPLDADDTIEPTYVGAQPEEIKKNFPSTSIDFNEKLWTNKTLQSSIQISAERCDDYKQSKKLRDIVNDMPDGTYKNIKTQHLYDIAPDEEDAYNAQESLKKQFGLSPKLKMKDNSFDKLEQALNNCVNSSSEIDKEKFAKKNDLCTYAYCKAHILKDKELSSLYQEYTEGKLPQESFKNRLYNVLNKDQDDINKWFPEMTQVLLVNPNESEIEKVLSVL